MRGWRLCAAVLLVCASACARGREYQLEGQILAVDPGREEITVKHGDIRGFMPGMTMAFKVRDAGAMTGRAPGELIRATLVVEDTQAYLTSIEVTGRAPLTEAPPPPRIDPLEPGALVPDVTLVDDAGKPRQLSDWRGHTLAVTFIYTRCPLPDFCPLVDRQFAQVQRELLDDRQLRDAVRLLSISFDPEFDTPPVLAAHAKKVGADPSIWTFLTGERANVEAFAGKFGVSLMRQDPKSGDVVHNLRTAVIDKNGRLVKIVNGIQWQSSELIADLRSAIAGR